MQVHRSSSPEASRGMKILVTGGAGFIGSHVVDRLVQAGHVVRVVDCLHPAAHEGKPDYLNDGAEYLWGDLRDEKLARRAVEGMEAVCHQASMVGLGKDLGDISDYVQHNDVATAALLRMLFAGGQEVKLVLAGSMVIYGEGAYSCPDHGSVRPLPRSEGSLRLGRFEVQCPTCRAELSPQPIEETACPNPQSVYAATKLHQEHLMEAFARATGAPLVRLRYHNVYGDRMPSDTPYAGVASIFRSSFELGQRAQVFEDGRQLRDFIHVEDVARANEIALSQDASGVFNICTGQPKSVLDMAVALGRAFQEPLEPEVTGAFRAGDVRHVFSSPEKARNALGFSAEVGFEEGMASFATARSRRPPLEG